MTPIRRLATIPIIGAALGLLAFGVVRGASDPGPGRGTRLAVAVDPPLDTDARQLAERVIRERIELKGAESRIVGTNDGFIVEVAEDDPEIIAAQVVAIEAGAVHPMHVVRRDPFTRATGFWPRSAPFLAIAAVLLLVAAFVWRGRDPGAKA